MAGFGGRRDLGISHWMIAVNESSTISDVSEAGDFLATNTV